MLKTNKWNEMKIREVDELENEFIKLYINSTFFTFNPLLIQFSIGLCHLIFSQSV